MSTGKMVPYTTILNNKEDQSDSLLIKLEKLFLFLPRSEGVEVYKNFDDQIRTYLNKINGPSKDVASQLLDRGAILMLINSKKSSNILGAKSSTSDGKLLFVGIECSAFDVEITNGDIGNIEELINQVYYQFIRHIIDTFPEIQKNQDLHTLLIQYYTFLLLKSLRIPTLVDKKVEVLKYITGIMYYKHFLNMDPYLAKERSLSLIDPKFQKEIESMIPDTFILKYTDIKDIIKLIIDTKLVFDTPNNLTYHMLNSLKVISFLSVTSTFSHLLSSIIASLSSIDFYKPLLINKPIQEHIESILIPYFTKVKYIEFSKYTVTSTKKEE